MIPEILKKRPLVFGDPLVLSALKQVEEEEKYCEACDGEGQIECSDCDGTGKKDE